MKYHDQRRRRHRRRGHRHGRRLALRAARPVGDACVDPAPGARRLAHRGRHAGAGHRAALRRDRRCCGSTSTRSPRYPALRRRARAEATGLPTGYRRVRHGRGRPGTRADLAALRDLHAFAARLGVDGATADRPRAARRSSRRSRPGCPAGCWRPTTTRSTRGCCTPRCCAARDRAGVAVRRRRPRPGSTSTATGSRRRARRRAPRWPPAPWCSRPARGRPGRRAARRLARPVRPVKGQTLRLRLPGAPRLRRVVRGDGRGSPVYVVPRARRRAGRRRVSRGGRLRPAPRAGAVYELLRDAQSRAARAQRGGARGGSTGLRPGLAGQRAARSARPGWPGWSTPPGTTATASCSPRSPPTASPSCSPTARCPTSLRAVRAAPLRRRQVARDERSSSTAQPRELADGTTWPS